MTEPGRIVLLNGTSSSGKSSIAAELLRRWPTPAFRLAVDDFNAMRAKAQTLALDEPALLDALRRTRAGFHRAVAGMAGAGNDVIMDHLLSEPWRLADCLELFRPYPVFFVGVVCKPAELARRELARGDREPGTAAAQLALVHAHGEYDLTVDTTHRSAADCSADILTAIMRPPEPSAFRRLAERTAAAAADGAGRSPRAGGTGRADSSQPRRHAAETAADVTGRRNGGT